MVGVSRAVVIIEMATDAFGRGVRKITGRVAAVAVRNIMPLHQRKKIMDDPRAPSATENVVALHAVRAEAR